MNISPGDLIGPLSVLKVGINGLGSTANIATDTFTGGGPYTLSHTPNGGLMLLFFNGLLEPLSSIDFDGNLATLASGVDSSLFDIATFVYSY